MDTIQTTALVQSLSNFTCSLWMMRGEILLILGHRVKGQGQIWHSVYKALLANYRLQFISDHFQTSHVDDDGRNPIDFGSRGHGSSSTLPPARGCRGLRFLVLSAPVWWKSNLAVEMVSRQELALIWPTGIAKRVGERGGGLGILPQNLFCWNSVKSSNFRQYNHENAL